MDDTVDGDDDEDDDDGADDDGDDTCCARFTPQLHMLIAICLCTFPIADWADAADGLFKSLC